MLYNLRRGIIPSGELMSWHGLRPGDFFVCSIIKYTGDVPSESFVLAVKRCRSSNAPYSELLFDITRDVCLMRRRTIHSAGHEVLTGPACKTQFENVLPVKPVFTAVDEAASGEGMFAVCSDFGFDAIYVSRRTLLDNISLPEVRVNAATNSTPYEQIVGPSFQYPLPDVGTDTVKFYKSLDFELVG